MGVYVFVDLEAEEENAECDGQAEGFGHVFLITLENSVVCPCDGAAGE